jgi:hypothetical protein
MDLPGFEDGIRMVENQVNKNGDQQRSWLDFLPLVLSFFGAVVSIGGAILTYSSQAQVAEASLWPLPGFVLLDWAILGLIGFLAAYLSFKQLSAKWQQVAWFITGTFIPLIVLGAVSIGPVVLIAFLLFLTSTIILAIRNRAKWLESFGLFMLGAIVNLLLLYIIITLGNQNY